jgi:hypothetical protein
VRKAEKAGKVAKPVLGEVIDRVRAILEGRQECPSIWLRV